MYGKKLVVTRQGLSELDSSKEQRLLFLPLDHPHLRNGLLLQPHRGHHHICEKKINLKSRFAKD